MIWPFRERKAGALTGGSIENALGADAVCNGVIKSDGNMRLDGVFEGRIETAGNVIVGPSARLRADIVANSVQIWGQVRGDVTARGRLEILSGGQVWGTTRAGALSIEDGGVLRGPSVVASGELQPPLMMLSGGSPVPETANPTLPDGSIEADAAGGDLPFDEELAPSEDGGS